MKLSLKTLQRSVSGFLIVLMVSVSVGLLSPRPALAFSNAVDYRSAPLGDIVDSAETFRFFDYHWPESSLLESFGALPELLLDVLSDNELMLDADNFLSTSSDTVCSAYADSLAGMDKTWIAMEKSARSALLVADAVTSASAAGAGSLAGYAGVASAVSHLGLGGVMTFLSGLMGHSVAGAAATSVVTSAVGGPVVMGALVVAGTGAAAFGTYELGKFTADQFGDWAASYCAL